MAPALTFGSRDVPLSVLDLAPVPDGGAAVPSPEEAAAYPYSELERAFVADRQASSILGSPETVTRQLTDLVQATAADELMVTTMVYDPADHLRSFELVADLARASRPAAVS